jgi:iron complex transport system permease protein
MFKAADDGAKKSSLEIFAADTGKKRVLLLILIVLLCLAILYSGAVGSAGLSLADVFLSIMDATAAKVISIATLLPGQARGPVVSALSPALHVFGAPADDIAEPIVVNIRLPRILLCVLTGISLAMAGAVMQGVLRNPLVSPFTLGLSSAASFGAALAIVVGTGMMGAFYLDNQNTLIVLTAFLFGCLSMALVYLVTKMSDDRATVILAGVVVGYMFSAGLLVLKYVTNNEKLREITIWLMGGMWGANWGSVMILLPIVLIGFLLLVYKAWDLNAMSSGDEVAVNLGVDVRGTRLFYLMAATFVASSCLAFTGVIGFIGLMAPHICRMLIGNDHRYLIPCSALMGGLILLLSDTFARTVFSPMDLPVGIVMYVIGGVFFLYLILRGKESRQY